MSIRYVHVSYDETYGDLPIERWVLHRESRIAPRFDLRSGPLPLGPAVAYAKEYSLLDPRLWLREHPISMRTVSACAAVAAAGISLGVLVDPAAFMISVAAALLAVLVTLVCFVEDIDGFGGGFDRSRPVMRISGTAVPQVLDAYKNDPEATMEALRVLAKGDGVASDEALDLAAEIIGRLAKHQRELEECEKVRKEAEAEALAKFNAAAEVAPIIDRSDEIALARLSAELDLQGK